MWGLSNKMLCTILAQKGAVKVLKSKVGGLKIWYFELTLTFHCACKSGRTRFSPFFFELPNLTSDYTFVAPWGTQMHSISFESPYNSLMVWYLVKSIAVLLNFDFSIQSALIYAMFI